MENEIPANFWMLIITGLSILFGLILYHLAMILREFRETVSEFTETVRRSNALLDEAQEVLVSARGIVKTAEGVVSEVSDTVIKPLRSVGSVFTIISGVLSGFASGSDKS